MLATSKRTRLRLCPDLLLLLLLQVLAGEGRVYKCLFNHKFEEAMSERVSLTGSRRWWGAGGQRLCDADGCVYSVARL